MDISAMSVWSWAIIVVAVCATVLWLLRRNAPSASSGGMLRRIKEGIRVWLQAAGREEVIKQLEHLKRNNKELTDRLASVESTLSHQGRLEDLTSDVRRRLTRLETFRQSNSEGQSATPAIPGSLQRLGVRVNVTDLIWGRLGVVKPDNLTDQQIDRMIQGPFCRNCLRSLILSSSNDGVRQVRNQCRHCSLIWRDDPDIFLIPIAQIKRDIYQHLDAEYRNTGTITMRDG